LARHNLAVSTPGRRGRGGPERAEPVRLPAWGGTAPAAGGMPGRGRQCTSPRRGPCRSRTSSPAAASLLVLADRWSGPVDHHPIRSHGTDRLASRDRRCRAVGGGDRKRQLSPRRLGFRSSVALVPSRASSRSIRLDRSSTWARWSARTRSISAAWSPRTCSRRSAAVRRSSSS